MKKIIMMSKKLIILLMFLINIIYIPIIAKADSGLDASYESTASIADAGLSSGSSLISVFSELTKSQPTDEDYESYHIIVTVICAIICYIFTNIYIFKLDKTKPKKTKNIITLLIISLIPTIVFLACCLLTKLQLVFYFLVLIIYVIAFKIATKIILKNTLQRNLTIVKEIDEKFNEEEFNQEVFNIYKEIQLDWMNFELDKVKDLISDEIFNDYKTKLDDLKSNKQKNIMDKIEYKSNKITDIKIDNNKEIIECELNVTCNDYIIDNEEKVVKGKKDKTNNYLYKLVFNKDLNNNKYILVSKKMLKQK